MGIILGAPLNILATERLHSDKGTAISTLSLSRQIGMTIAPTIYAGFIARGFNELPSLFKTEFPGILQDNIKAANLGPEGLAELGTLTSQMSGGTSGMTEAEMNQVISQIQDPALKEAVLSSVQEVTTMAAQNGYSGLFYTAVVIAVLIIIATAIMAPIRKKTAVTKQSEAK